jgi:predicted enzyme related to lactoylglutathione lyase
VAYPIAEVVLDCSDPPLLAAFYRDLLGARPRQSRPEWATIWADPIIIGFQRVPESKAVKNRVHLDFTAADLLAAAEHAESLGAVRQGAVVIDPPGAFIVLQDPEGNEFCFVTGYPDEPER